MKSIIDSMKMIKNGCNKKYYPDHKAYNVDWIYILGTLPMGRPSGCYLFNKPGLCRIKTSGFR